MIYINESSNIVEFPRASKMIVDSLVITNQTTKQSIKVDTEDSYNVDLTDKIANIKKFHSTHYSLYIYGLCNKCHQAAKRRMQRAKKS